MGKTLVIYAHPHTKGYCPCIREEVEKQLRAKKIEYSLFDLYAMKYDPILHENEHYTAGPDHRHLSEQTKMFQQKITEAEKLIFIYPIWWNSPPAILKGWLDKVLTSHFGFKFSPKGMPIKLLTGRKALILITGGTPKFFAWLLLRNRAAKIMAKDTLGFCGIKTKACQFGGCTKLEDKKVENVLSTVRNKLSSFYGW
jgi:putative NADPH-quinone reductase